MWNGIGDRPFIPHSAHRIPHYSHPKSEISDPPSPRMHIALITAGGAGMFCGSCMHDNTLARALMAAGHEVSLIPTYTPIRVDERDASRHQVFLGGINVYLDAAVPLWQRLPRAFVRWLDAPGVIRLVSRIGISANARKLGRLTVALLEGDHGPQAREIDELADF